jgi:hypothetical protein
VVALLEDGDPVEGGVELAFAAAVQAVAARAARDRCGAAEARERNSVLGNRHPIERIREVTGLDNQPRRALRTALVYASVHAW